MIRYYEALSRLLDAAARRPRLTVDELPLLDAAGRVAAEPVRAPEALPRFDNSAMDGYAVAASRTARASRRHPVELPVAGSIVAGDAPTCSPRPGFAWEIMTGAPIPAGCDAVARVEDVERLAEGRAVLLRAPADPGDFVRRKGADIPKGAVVLAAGTPLSPGALLALAAAGHSRVRVGARPRVAVIATGRELVAPGCAVGAGQVHDGSSTFLRAALPALGADVDFRGGVGDEPGAFAKALAGARKAGADLILTTGAVSKGRFDFVASALAEAGARTLFHGVAIRPGKPILAASFENGPLALGLPGNPVSTVVGLRFFVAALLRAWLGLEPEAPIRAPLAEAAEKPDGLRCFFKARVEAAGASNGWSARVLRGQASFQVAPLVEANAWVVLPESGARLRSGAEVDAYPRDPQDSPFPAPAKLRRASPRSVRP